MRVVGLEERYVTADVVDAWTKLDPRWQDTSPRPRRPPNSAGP
ncbi:MAG TPA: hypothetical protein VH185_05635 [Mycobacterium sp.]|jgi:hypothetical protein|nr:hypothetical protein [Mycobacterium sp.]